MENQRAIREKEGALLQRLIEGLQDIKKVVIYRAEYDRVPTVCFNVVDVASSDVVKYLDSQGICVRGGIHCAILAHETIGTVETGAVRASINAFNTEAEVDEFIRVIGAI